MARFAVIQGGTVANITESDASFAQAQGWIAATDAASIGDLCDGSTFSKPPLAPLDRAAASAEIDDVAAAAIASTMRFASIYTERETQAQAFKDAGYTGTVPVRVQEFATPAGLTAQVATDTILSQAASIRATVGLIEGQRMRKYEMQRAADDATARAALADVLAQIAVHAAQL